MSKDVIKVERYKDDKAYQKGAKRMAKKGYKPINVESHKPHTSGCRLLAGGILFGRKKPIIIVTYQLQEEAEKVAP